MSRLLEGRALRDYVADCLSVVALEEELAVRYRLVGIALPPELNRVERRIVAMDMAIGKMRRGEAPCFNPRRQIKYACASLRKAERNLVDPIH
jgi:hypothetical protein